MFYQILFSVLLFFMSQVSYGKTYLDKTRVIINEVDNEGTVNVKNVDSSSILLQMWIDNGDVNQDVLTTKTPFLITSPIVKVSGGDSHQIRILSINKSSLPNNKESVFWLNVLEIKEKKKDSVEDKVNVSFRTRIKLFYRPDAIGKLINDDTNEMLTFQLIGSNGNMKIRVNNPTPVYKTFSYANNRNDKNKNIINGVDMVAPFSNTTWNVNGNILKGDIIEFLTINDSGLEDYGTSIIK